MNRPRIAVIVSAVAASTAAFFVTSRYHLAGTLAGAVLFPVIIILVSHSSTQGVDAVHKWVRRRRADEPDVTDAPESAALPARPAARPAARGRSQWWLTGLAGVAVAVSVYALVAEGDPTVVRQTVIQRVTESSEAASPAASVESTTATTEVGPGGTTATTAASGVTTTTTDTTATTGTTAPLPETTTTSAAGGGSSTTDTAQGSDTTLR